MMSLPHISATSMKRMFPLLPVWFLLAFGSPFLTKAQFTNEFAIGEYVEFFANDSIRVFFNCSGKVCRQSCASFYRTGFIDKDRITVYGKFRDYYMNDSLAFEAVMDSGYIHGKAKAWFSNGKLKSEGHYRKGVKTGIWKSYYADGQLKEIINYVRGFPLVSAHYTPRGKQQVTDGNGHYTGEYLTYRTCDPMEFRGKVSEGVLDGKVKIYSSNYRGIFGHEYYDKGKFLKGVSGNYNYNDAPKIELPGYNVHEQLMLDENTIYCPGFLGTSFLQYNNGMYWQFYASLLDSIHKNINYMVEDQWLAVGISITYRDDLYDVSVYSSRDDYRLEKDLFNIIIDMRDWGAAQVFWSKVNADLFFTILINRGRVIIPAELMRQKGIY